MPSAYRYFATKPDFASLPSDWTIVVMANNSNGPHPGRVHANAAFAPSLPMGWCRHSLSAPIQQAVFTMFRIFPAKSWIGERILTRATKFYSAAYNNLQLIK